MTICHTNIDVRTRDVMNLSRSSSFGDLIQTSGLSATINKTRKDDKMGLFSDMFKGAVNGINDMARFRSEYASYPDGRLISIARGEGIFGSKFTEKAAALAVLKDRYGEEGAKEKIRNGY